MIVVSLNGKSTGKLTGKGSRWLGHWILIYHHFAERENGFIPDSRLVGVNVHTDVTGWRRWVAHEVQTCPVDGGLSRGDRRSADCIQGEVGVQACSDNGRSQVSSCNQKVDKLEMSVLIGKGMC